MRVLVTGANGHVGANVVRDLGAAGHAVTGLVRRGADVRGLRGVDVALREGDVCDAAAVRAAVDGMDAVVHLAQPYVTDPNANADAIVRPAVEGTRNVAMAMRDAGVKRMVFAGSSTVCGLTDDPARPKTEADQIDAEVMPYIAAKIHGERLSVELATEHDLEVVVALPGGCVGRYDYKTTPTHQPVFDAVNGKGPVPMAVCFTDVRDTAAGIRLALERGRAGERYLLTADALLPDAAADLIGELTGRRPSSRWPPRWVLVTAVTVLGWFGKAPMSRATLDGVFGRHFAFDSAKARTELGFAPRPAADALREALRWGAFVGALGPAPAARVGAALPPDPDWVR